MILMDLVKTLTVKDCETTIDDFIIMAKNGTMEDTYDFRDLWDTKLYLQRREELLQLVSFTIDGWAFISEKVDLPLEFIREFHDRLSWEELSYNIPYDEEFFMEFSDKVNWKVLFLKFSFDMEFLYKVQDKIRTSIIRSDMKRQEV